MIVVRGKERQRRARAGRRRNEPVWSAGRTKRSRRHLAATIVTNLSSRRAFRVASVVLSSVVNNKRRRRRRRCLVRRSTQRQKDDTTHPPIARSSVVLRCAAYSVILPSLVCDSTVFMTCCSLMNWNCSRPIPVSYRKSEQRTIFIQLISLPHGLCPVYIHLHFRTRISTDQILQYDDSYGSANKDTDKLIRVKILLSYF